MNFSKLKLNEGVATGDYTSLKTSQKVTGNAMRGSQNMARGNNASNAYQSKSQTSLGNTGGVGANPRRSKVVDRTINAEQVEKYFKENRDKMEYLKSLEGSKVDWRKDLQEKLVDGKEEDNHPFVTVMPTGDENLMQAIKQLRGEVKDKKQKVGTGMNVEEEYTQIEEKKEDDCKKGYTYNKKTKQCEKKKSSSKTYVRGPMYIGIGHHHHDDDKDDNSTDNGGGDGGGESGGGGMGEAFDLLGNMMKEELSNK